MAMMTHDLIVSKIIFNIVDGISQSDPFDGKIDLRQILVLRISDFSRKIKVSNMQMRSNPTYP